MEPGFYAGMRQNNFYFGTEKKRIGGRPIVKRFYSQPVTGNKQSLLARIPNRECEHSAQMLHALATVLFVDVNDGFRVAMCTITMSSRLKLFPQSGMIVNFAVKYDPDRAVLVAERLVPRRNVNDAQAPHCDSNTAFDVNALVVGAAMRHGRAHPPQHLRIDLRVPVKLHYSRDPAHGFCPNPNLNTIRYTGLNDSRDSVEIEFTVSSDEKTCPVPRFHSRRSILLEWVTTGIPFSFTSCPSQKIKCATRPLSRLKYRNRASLVQPFQVQMLV